MRNRLRKLLENFSYQSSVGRGERKLYTHHIDALMKDLAPFIEQEVRDAVSSSSDDNFETIGWLGGDGR